MQPWALVTPASRGIGLELARRLLRTTDIPIVTSARKDLDQTRENLLSGLDGVSEDRLHVLKVDVLGHWAFHHKRLRSSHLHSGLTDEQTIIDAASTIASTFPKKSSYLHLALAVPGILYPEKSPSQIDYDNALHTFQVNTLGPMMLLKHFSPFLPKKATTVEELKGLPPRAVWANMSARVGSITDNALGGWYSYRASKAAVNQVTKTFDNHLKTSAGENAMAISLHPGTVKTDFSKEFWGNVKEEKLFSPEFSAEKLMEVVCGRKIEDRGKFFDWKSDEVPP
jgi:NAD(P)-dependent dehydrogenase (short-subunit alcohol dehydrogenase family)